LQAHLDAHPDVYVCAKSPNHFVASDAAPSWETPVARAMMRHWVKDRAEYLALFKAAGVARAAGEVSPVYMQSVAAPGRIHALCPDGRIVAILRDPVERAHAHFQGRRRDGIESEPSFERLVERELAGPLPEEVAFGHYLGCGRYHHFLRGYFERFPRRRIRVYLFEDFRASPGAVVADLFEFLGVDPELRVDPTVRLNRSGRIRNPALRALWTGTVGLRTRLRPYLPERLRAAAGAPFLRDLDRASIDPALRARMVGALREDIERTQELIDRDLAAWLRID
jgi:hypothetical protein